MYRLQDELSKYDVILGSTSPRRREILETNLGIVDFVIFPSNFAEDLPKMGLSPQQYVQMTSRCKADDIVGRTECQKYVLLCCDTIVCCGDEIFEKPGTKVVQRQMFEKYRTTGKISVISALTVVRKVDGETHTVCDTETTELVFNEGISDEFITSYIESQEGLNVAGGFKFQEKGSVLFKHISGDYFNIVGLPVSKTFGLLHRVLGI